MSGTILLVEDDDDIRELMAEVLGDEGYRVIEARDGREALDRLAQSGRVCAVLLDLFMPVMNGWDFYEALRHDPQRASLPVIVISSAPDQAPDGVQRVLPKPLTHRALTDAAREFCCS